MANGCFMALLFGRDVGQGPGAAKARLSSPGCPTWSCHRVMEWGWSHCETKPHLCHPQSCAAFPAWSHGHRRLPVAALQDLASGTWNGLNRARTHLQAPLFIQRALLWGRNCALWHRCGASELPTMFLEKQRPKTTVWNSTQPCSAPAPHGHLGLM